MVKATPMDVWKALGARISRCREELATMHGGYSPLNINLPTLDCALIHTAERLAFLTKLRDELRDMFEEHTVWLREE